MEQHERFVYAPRPKNENYNYYSYIAMQGAIQLGLGYLLVDTSTLGQLEPGITLTQNYQPSGL